MAELLAVSDRFAPLRHDEIANADRSSATAWDVVSPIPADHREPSEELLRGIAPNGFRFDRLFAVRDRDRRFLFGEVRFVSTKPIRPGEKPEKTYRPIALCRHTGTGRLEFRVKAPPAPRALFGLPTLAKPGAVLATEGTRKAETAVGLFPDLTAVSATCGADGPSTSDWSPLRGRDVVVWPDNDGASRERFVPAVVRGATAAGAKSVRVVQVPETWPHKWDLADHLPESVSAEVLRRMIEGAVVVKVEAADGPLPLFAPLPPAETFPVNALGPFLAEAASAIAAKVQVPIEIAAQSVLAASALAVQAHADVRLPYGQTRPTSLDFVTIAASGDRKSSADNEALRPVRHREKALREEFDAAMKDYRIDVAAWNATKKKIESDGKLDHDARRLKLAVLGEEPAKPMSPVLTTGDATVDGLTKNWPAMNGALGLFTAEGGQFTGGHGMTDENRLRTAAMLSELWDGKPIMRVRAMDGISILSGRRLSVHLMVQPDAAASFLANDTLRDQGLLSRGLVAAPASIAGSRLYRAPRHEDEQTIKRYGARLLSILETPPRTIGVKPNELDPRVLGISEDAEVVWVAFFDHVERQCAPTGELAVIRDFAAKTAEHAARLAAVIAVVERPDATEVDPEAMRCGVGLADWYLTEALRLARSSRTDPRLLKAKTLLDWLHERADAEIGFREIVQYGPNAVRTKAAAEDATTILVSHGWLREISQRPRRFAITGTEG